LHATEPAVVLVEGQLLDGAVIGVRDRPQPVARPPDALVVVAGDGPAADHVHAAVRGRQVLDQIAAAGHVDHLQAAADRQQRPAVRQRGGAR
jgi:hypothetical protein